MTTITNNFHNTEARIRAKLGETVSNRTAQRVRRALCGMDECRCGGDDKSRGSRYYLQASTSLNHAWDESWIWTVQDSRDFYG